MSEVGGDHLRRDLGVWDASALVVGGIIGASIFLVPAAVGNATGSPLLSLLVWVLAGVLAGASALAFAELAAALPPSGGTYFHLARAYQNQFIPFVFAWATGAVYGAGAVAVVAMMATSYLQSGIPALSVIEPRLLAVVLIGLVLGCNLMGVSVGGKVQRGLTLLKLLLILAVVAIPLALLSLQDVVAWPQQAAQTYSSNGFFGTVGTVIEGMALAMFSYSGAHFAAQLAGEVRNPQRALPLAIIGGFTTVMILYLLLNLTFLLALPFGAFSTSSTLAADVMTSAIGPAGATLTAIGIALSAIAVLNAQFLAYSRILMAAGSDGTLWAGLARLNRSSGAPRTSLTLVFAIATLFVLTGTYKEVLIAIAFVAQMMLVLAVAAVPLLRRREPDLVRPFRVWGYPWSISAFLLASAAYLVGLLIQSPFNVLKGLTLLLVGLPFYLARRRLAPAISLETGNEVR